MVFIAYREESHINVCIMLDEDLGVFTVSTEKSGVILIGLSLYVTWPFLFAALKSFLLSDSV